MNVVLEHLEPLQLAESLSSKLLTLKLVMIMVILSDQRCRTIHALSTRDMQVSDSQIVLSVNELLKNYETWKYPTKLEFLSYNANPCLCAVRYLSEYLTRTTDMTHDHHKLPVGYQKPHGPVSKDTVGRWLKHELKLAGIYTSTFIAHSTRAASNSAGWSSENTFTKYYNKAISKPKDNFGKQLLNAFQK